MKVAGHPAWASEYGLSNNSVRAMDVYSNTFCAGGASLGDGRWINVGGNQGITWGGQAVSACFYPGDPVPHADKALFAPPSLMALQMRTSL